MIVKIDKTKLMIIKTQKITYDNFFYDNKKLEEVEIGTLIMELKTIDLWIWDRKKLFLVTALIFNGCET